VDRAGNANLIGATARTGAAFALVSVVGASSGHPIGLFRAKHAAEDALRASGIPWTVVRATAFMETWGTIMSRPLQASGKTMVFGHGDNPINFVSATDVAALVGLAATDPSLRGQVFEIGGPDDLTFNQVAAIVQDAAGRHGTVRHIPRSALRAMACLTTAIKPALARQARAALAMDTLDLTFDSKAVRREFPGVPNTDMPSVLKELLA
jgi:NADH dehydrogenase